MRKILKSVISTLLLLVSLFFLPAVAAAQSITPQSADPCGGNSTGINKSLCGLANTEIGTTIGSILNIAFVIAIIIALFWLVYGGIKWILSGGDKTAVENARNHIVAAILGLVIVFLAYFIITFVLSFFGLSFKDTSLLRIGGPTATPTVKSDSS